MKKLLVIALICFVTSSLLAQSITPVRLSAKPAHGVDTGSHFSGFETISGVSTDYNFSATALKAYIASGISAGALFTSYSTVAHTGTSIAANQLMLFNLTGTGAGGVETLPSAAGNFNTFAAKLVAKYDATDTVILTCASGDTFNVSGGSNKYILRGLNQGIMGIYDSTHHLWYILADDLPVSYLNTLYGTVTSVNVVPANNISGSVANPTTVPSITISIPGTPVAATDAVPKSYVDAAIAALNPAQAVAAISTGTNFSATYSNGSSGVGATLTATSTGTVVFDGYTTLLNDRILFASQTSAFQNGVYVVTTAGATGVAAVFTRATDYNTPTNITNSGAVPVINGTSYAGSEWLLTSIVTTIGTSALNYIRITTTPPPLHLNSGHMFVGNSSNVATDVTPSGAFTMSNTGVSTETTGTVTNAASTTNIGAAGGTYVQVNNTTTITAFDVMPVGTRRVVKFKDGPLLTYNSTSLVLPTGANIQASAGDIATFISLGSGNWDLRRLSNR